MRKLTALFIISILVLLVFSMGCGKEENGKKTVSSRPVTAKPAGTSTATEPATTVVEESTTTETTTITTKTPSGSTAECELLSNTDLATVFGGTWVKTSDCPQRPAMPKGVDVCRCDYDGPKQVYVNVEVQLYDDSTEAERVYNMYCKGTAEESEVGTYSCRVARTDSLRPNFVYFLDGSYFVKVACLGGTCPLNSVAEIAKKVEAQI
jgi:hypothetical protein